MENILEYISSTIFKDMFTEAKVSLPSVNMSIEEWVNNLIKDDGKAEVKEYQDKPKGTRFGDDSNIIVTTSLLTSINYAKDKDNRTFAIIPFNNFWIVADIFLERDNYIKISLFAIKPTNVGLKSILNNTRSAFKCYINLYTFKKDNIKDILSQIKDRILKDKEFINDIKSNFSDETIEKQTSDKAAAKVPSPDKSPYTLSKVKKLPDYIRRHIVRPKDNPIVKKYTLYDEAEILVETVKKDNKKYYRVLMGDVRADLEGDYNRVGIYYLTTLGQLDKFLEYTLKPARRRHNSELGPDGEIHTWTSKIEKKLPPILQKDCIHDEALIKSLKFHDFSANSIYSNDDYTE